MTALPVISARRRRTDLFARGVFAALTLVAIVPLVLIIYYILDKGLGAISWHFLSTDPTGNFLGDPGGVKSAILGTLEIVLIATALAVPIGIGVALYLVEFGRGTVLGGVVRYFVDVLTGVPSIVFGLFIYTGLVVTHTLGSFAGWKGAVALALLMLPVVTRSAEVVLILVPDSLREAALALGAPRWRVVARVVLPSALTGLITGGLLAVARAAGETAPLIFTMGSTLPTNFDPFKQMNSLPVQIFNDVGQAQDRLVTRAWGAALTLVAMILILTLIARTLARRSRLT
ncbi:MAG: phosphate ABC transporter permease PstA [Actinobacteria bacterium]|nr:MAG: phosphate ABC transporter permease PstA [Actinomycetota bacterium]